MLTPKTYQGVSHISQTNKEMECMIIAIQMEAGNQSVKGKLAVAEVIKNRYKSGKFGKSLCEVIKQNTKDKKTGKTVYQFSFVGDGSVHTRGSKKQWYESAQVALYSLYNSNKILPENAYNFHADYITYPVWSYKLKLESKIGNHLFYSTPVKLAKL